MKRRKTTEFIIPPEIATSEEFSFGGYYGMLVRDQFSEIPNSPNRSLYFKDETWMKYHKCPLCGQYVLKVPERIKVPRGSAGTHRINMWNEALWIICWDKEASPCINCVSDLTRYLTIDHPITATRTGLVVGGDYDEKTY